MVSSSFSDWFAVWWETLYDSFPFLTAIYSFLSTILLFLWDRACSLTWLQAVLSLSFAIAGFLFSSISFNAFKKIFWGCVSVANLLIPTLWLVNFIYTTFIRFLDYALGFL